jgi:alpha-L-fucosidase
VRIEELEDTLTSTGDALINAEKAHRAALRRAVETGEFAPTQRTQAARDVALTDHSAITSALAIARDMLREALAAEATAEKVSKAAAIEALLVEVAQHAADADRHFAAFAEALSAARRLELDAQRATVHAGFRAPWGGPEMGAACHATAQHLRALVTAISEPGIEAWSAKAASSATRRIQASLSDG